jgi:acyl carrier protein
MYKAENSQISERLSNCFATVFPDLTPEEIPRASHASVATWDSLATVTLIAVIEEEFGVSVEPEAFDYMVSYDLALEYLEKKVGDARG